MPENLKELLRKVYSIDTEAGHKVRYHIMRALACEDYAKEIDFDIETSELGLIFLWKYTHEKYGYWKNIAIMYDE